MFYKQTYLPGLHGEWYDAIRKNNLDSTDFKTKSPSQYGDHQYNFMHPFKSMIGAVRNDVSLEHFKKITKKYFMHPSMFPESGGEYPKHDIFVGIDVRKNDSKVFLYNSRKESLCDFKITRPLSESQSDRNFAYFYQVEYIKLYHMAKIVFHCERNAEDMVMFFKNKENLNREYYRIIESIDFKSKTSRNPSFYNIANHGCFQTLSKPDLKRYKFVCKMDHLMGEMRQFFNTIRESYSKEFDQTDRNYYSAIVPSHRHLIYCFMYLCAEEYLKETGEESEIERYKKIMTEKM